MPSVSGKPGRSRRRSSHRALLVRLIDLVENAAVTEVRLLHRFPIGKNRLEPKQADGANFLQRFRRDCVGYSGPVSVFGR